ncbi:MAG: HTH domain-containing protein [Cytophagales bacterium]|nr:HTH domain-containing protein [Cytophagales bacterium]
METTLNFLAMAIQEIMNRMQRIDHLIKMKATGSPGELAVKLSVSKRQIYRYLEMIKSQGKEIHYEPLRRSYTYKE